MKPLRDFHEPARQLDCATFCAMFPSPVLVHTALDHRLVPEQEFDSPTLKQISWQEMSRASPEAYMAFVIDVKDGKTVVVGSGEDCDVHVDDASLSEQHAEIAIEAGAYRIRDLLSLFGTRINGRTLAPEAFFPLVDNDRVQLGHARFFFMSARSLYKFVRELFDC